ncbi:putative monocarboxylate transporter [Aspergillus nomiae NRRL 13137]|uniref:Putative monocarboxylate transporter n=1 Tax=Aspergillus nomiae NRRL (strain ATCC 15546 / NRRL 13137 / CBS 260.88 / M93) TaxID=1509407 RepID=A0A0L1JBI3_ASPN3|nr:putative monocarboxylate transporter [Aspergillus nomiae NRRL 13137]KNG89131.1 putative monocarboxylate transporter [Aspergillus nomiae NRRL 13137]
MPTPTATDQCLPTRNDSSSAETSAGHERNEKNEPWTPPDEAPDGGVAAWLMVLGAWCVLFCSFGWINSIGEFQAYYEHNLLRQYSSSKISWIPSLQIFFMFAMGPVAGQIYDRFGPRYLLLGGSLLHVFGLMMTSISKSYYQILLSQGVCSAIGVAAVFQAGVSSIPSWFNKKRGAVYGIVSSGSSIGGVVYPIMISKLIRILGFPWTMRICAFMILFLLIIANLTVRSRLPPSPQKLSKESLMQPFKELKMMLLVAGFFLLTFGIFVPMNYLVTEAIAKGMSRDLAEYLVAILNAGSLFGRLGAGIFADTIGPYNIFVVVTYIASILVLAVWIPISNNPGTIVFAVLFGFATGAYVALAPGLVVKLSPFPEIGYRTGLLFLFASISGLTANPIAGTIFQHSGGSYTGMKIFSGVLLIAGSTLTLGVRLCQTGMKLKAVF